LKLNLLKYIGNNGCCPYNVLSVWLQGQHLNFMLYWPSVNLHHVGFDSEYKSIVPWTFNLKWLVLKGHCFQGQCFRPLCKCWRTSIKV